MKNKSLINNLNMRLKFYKNHGKQDVQTS